MDLHQCIEKRRTVREFADVEIPQEVIDRALEAGLKAPSYNHLKQWDFILVRDQNTRIALTQTEKMIERTTKELEKSLSDYEDAAKQMYLHAIPKQKEMILKAPEVLVVVYKPKTQIKEAERVYDLNCLASVWCSIENILLSLAEDNVFGVTFIPQNTEAVKSVLNIPETLEVAAIIPFGYKAPEANIIPQKEVALRSKLHINKW